jgi:uncharacterized membrane protein
MMRLYKTGTYWICHITVAFSLAYALTGNWHAAFAIGLLEPSVQALVFYVHEIAWDGVQLRSGKTALSPPNPAFSPSASHPL